MRATFRTQLISFSLLSAALAAIVGGIGYFVANKLHAGEENLLVTVRAIQNHMQGDMMHDALHADVFYALLSAQAGEDRRAAIAADVKEHGDIFRKVLEENDALPLGDEVRAAIAEARPKLDAYITEAAKVADLAFTDLAAAKAAQPEFQAAFEDLEQTEEKLSRLIEDISAASQNTDDESFDNARTTLLAALLLGSCVILLLGQRMGTRILKRTRGIAQATERIARGELEEIPDDGSRDELKQVSDALNSTTSSLRALLDETQSLSRAALEGRLDTRAQSGRFEGKYKELCEGINGMLDATLEPIQESIQVLEHVAAGDLTVEVKGDYKGDHEKVKRGLNHTLAVLRSLLEETERLITCAKAGQLSERAAADRFHGSYRGLCEQINQMLDAAVKPVEEATSVLERIGKRDLTARVEGRYSGDHEKIKTAVNAAASEMQQAILSIGENALALSESSLALTSVSKGMSSSAVDSAARVGQVSGAAEEINRNVQTVATATSQMTAAIQEISKQSAEASRVTAAAVEVASETNATVKRLDEASTQIDQVVKLITAIAGQTNLLALNATIEAARAGDAGKGFAVVATEVKNLAMETSRATEEISQKISAIQGETRTAVDAIARIGAVISRVNEINTSIAAAVEEQTATTEEIARNVDEVARGTNQIAEGISGVAELAKSTSEGATQTGETADEFSMMANSLSTLVKQFRYEQSTRSRSASQV
ncbi:MAG: HAMP domain-containing protein [Planctomycetes bacterium]|nr:HAMP domain-containing protein [Planctomycetota bacterium]